MTGGEKQRSATIKIEKIDGGDTRTKVKMRIDSDAAVNKKKFIATDTLEIDRRMISARGRIGIVMTKETSKISDMTGVSSKKGEDK